MSKLKELMQGRFGVPSIDEKELQMIRDSVHEEEKAPITPSPILYNISVSCEVSPRTAFKMSEMIVEEKMKKEFGASTIRATPVTLEYIEQVMLQHKTEFERAIICVIAVQFITAFILGFMIYFAQTARCI